MTKVDVFGSDRHKRLGGIGWARVLNGYCFGRRQRVWCFSPRPAENLRLLEAWQVEAVRVDDACSGQNLWDVARG